MYNLLLVDDEYFVLDGMESAIDWKSYGFDQVFKAKDGVQAMEVVDHHTIDLIITDMRMPLMNGAEFICRLRNRNRQCKVIVLSGYDDFDYAQQVIKYNVVDYLLKPISLPRLRETVERAIELYAAEQGTQMELARMQEQLKESMPLLEEKFYRDLMDGEYNGDAAAFFKIPEQFAAYQTAVFHIDNIDALPKVFSEDPESNRQLAVIHLEDLIEDLRAELPEIRIVRRGGYDLAILLMGDGDHLAAVAHIKDYVVQAGLYTVSVGMGRCYGNIRSAGKSCEEAVNALHHKLYLGNNTILQYRDIDMIDGAPDFDLAREKDEIRNCLVIRNSGELDRLMTDLRKKLSASPSGNLQYFRQLGMELILSATMMLYEKNENPESVICNYSQPLVQVSGLETIGDILQMVEEIYHQTIDYLNSKSELKNLHTIRLIEQFVRDNLQNDINLDALSNRVHLTPNYIGTIFKNATNMNFSEYVLRVRMEKAKELLKDPLNKIYGVAAAVGYKNPHYFSKIFRDYTGYNPSDYKK